MVATIEALPGEDEIPLGVLEEVTVTAPEQEVQELRGAGSTSWQDVQKTETAAGVSGTWSAFALDSWDQLVDYDEAASMLDDQAEVKMFQATVEFTASDGSTKELVAGPGYVDGSVELSADRESWVDTNFDLRCKTISDINNTDATE